jgi:hypothetical protein
MAETGIESIQIHFNSLYANTYNNGLTSDCNFYLNNVIEIPVQHTIYLSVINASIPFSFYNIDSTNNVLNYIINSVSYSLVITPGNYNAIQLASFFNSNLSVGFTCTYNAIINKYTFTHTTYDFSFLSTSTCLQMLGFSTLLYSLSKTLTSSFCVNLQTKQCLCLVSNLDTGNISFCSMKSPNVLCSIPICTQPNSNIVYVNQYSFRSNLFSNVLNYIKLKLVDQDMKAINLNGVHWTCTMQIDIIKFVE